MVLTAAILAGGQSRRMGTDKAFVCIDGTPLVVRTAATIRASGVPQVYTVGRQPDLVALSLPTITEVNQGRHPLFGIAAALDALQDELVLFLPCDLVNLTPQHIQTLTVQQGPCVASCNGVTHPLFCILPKTLATTALDLASAGKAAHCLIDGLPTVELPNPILVDANLPEQLPR